MGENEKNYLDWEGLLEYHENLEIKLSEKANTEDLADVATSGDYNDLENTPTNVSLFTNDAGYITSEIDNTNGHDYVEIGGIKWATMNIGAENITDIGLYFQWGDILGYTSEEVGVDKNFTWEDYKFNPSGDGTTFSKYNSTDLKISLDTEDDAAASVWGSDWRVPTTSELQTLSNVVNVSWTNDYEDSGVPGLILTDKEDSSKVLFLPATGVCTDDSIIDDDTTGFYWSKSLGNTDDKGLGLGFDEANGTTWEYSNYRSLGFAIRPVLEGPAKRIIMGVTQLEKDKWNNSYSKEEINDKLDTIELVTSTALNTLNENIENPPIASANTLGNVKIGDGLSIDQNGVLSAESVEVVQITGTSTTAVMSLNAVTNELSNKTTTYIGVCDTEPNVLNKEVTISSANFILFVGCVVGVKYTNTNTASITSENKITLNVNNTGAKHIYYNNQADPEGVLPIVYGEANKYIYYMYDGTYWVWQGVDYVIDTKNTTGASATLSKIYIVGAESQQAEAQTHSQSTAYVGTDGCLYSDGQKVLTSHQDISGKADVSDLQDLETAIKYNNVLGTTISSSERTAWNAKVDSSSVGAANGVASLDANGKVPSTQLPSYVDDVIEGYYHDSKFYEHYTPDSTGDDAAQAAWGEGWRMPTTTEFEALGEAVNAVWTSDYESSGVAGIVCTDKEDSSKVLFFPAAGEASNIGSNDGYYWSSSLHNNNAGYAYKIYFFSLDILWGSDGSRDSGYLVRPILASGDSTRPYVEIGGVKWSTVNIGAESEIDAGLYFLWGDTQGYAASQVGTDKIFDWTNYKYGNGTSSPGAAGMTKYNSTDGLTTLQLGTPGSYSDEITPETGKIYVDLPYNKTYRWGGSSYAEISESLAIGTTAGTACEGNDSRLSDSRPASDVYSWAKAATKPTYTLSEVGGLFSSVLVDSNLNNLIAPETIVGVANDGKIAHVIYVNNGGANYTIAISTSSGYITPDGNGITLNCPQNGYCEVSYLNIGGTIYARGI